MMDEVQSLSNLEYKNLYNKLDNVGKRNIYRIMVEKPKGKRPLGRKKHRWVDNIR
jgi:hypothetical protein